MAYNELKRRCLERFFSRTNDRQREAIFHTQGAVLIIAGAGSGKTTVLCNRIANLLLFGDAYNSDFEPVLEDDEKLLISDTYQDKIAECIFVGVISFLNLE